MKYPRIYSISTVGILRHYNQDYLINSIRTDFTGNNGTGKSIIADLMQLIFIPDKDFFAFGTDSKGRHISSLPYKVPEAYAFMNIEVEPGTFVTIGVCIASNQNSKSLIKPFIIINSEDPTKPLSEIGLGGDKLPFYQQFIKDKKIPNLKDLTRHLRDSYSLSLLSYTYRADKTEYYEFLYKHIIPINLTIESNLKAYANVIQSFSRAKSLKASDSQSLQNFLFELDHKESNEELKRNKDKLDTLLLQYKNLEEDIQDLEEKQTKLESLEGKEKSTSSAFLEYAKSLILQKRKELKHAKKELEKTENRRIEQEQIKIDLEIKNPKDKVEIEALKLGQATANQAHGLLIEYQKKVIELQRNEAFVRKLKAIDPPKISYVFKEEADIHKYTEEGMISGIEAYKTLHNKYGSLETIEKKCKEHQRIVEKTKNELDKEIMVQNQILEIMTSNKEGSLFHQVLKSSKKLLPEQETVLFHLITVMWNKPLTGIKSGIRFSDDLSILDPTNIEYDASADGYWLNLGSLKEFVPKSKKKRLLDNAHNIEKSLEKEAHKLKEAIEHSQENILRLEEYQNGKIDTVEDLSLNPKLRSFAEILKKANLTKQAVSVIKDKEDRHDQIRNELAQLQEGIPFKVKEEVIDLQIKEAKTAIEQNNKALSDLEIEHAKNKEILKTSIARVSELQESINHLAKIVKSKELDLIEEELHVKNVVPDFKIELSDETYFGRIDPVPLKGKYDKLQADYVSEYKLIIHRFEKSTNPEVKEQLDQLKYSFRILEKVLLGKKISHRDKITDLLRESNRQRREFARMIHENIYNIFSKTKDEYKKCKSTIRDLNTFFKKHIISERFYFNIEFIPIPSMSIDWINEFEEKRVSFSNELNFNDSVPVEEVIEDVFKKMTGHKNRIKLSDLLNPKSYFELKTGMIDEDGVKNSGSTGESYTAIVLLGIGRLSIVPQKHEGLRFIILEEIANLDKTNFGTFPSIAEKLGYQILTMTPSPYSSDNQSGWYLHHLIKTSSKEQLNSPELISYFKTNTNREDLVTYLNRQKNELGSN